MDVHEVLVKARNILDHDGWVQGDWGRSGGPRCAVGAVEGADPDAVIFADVVDVLSRAAELPQDGWGMVIDWNNAPERTKAEVLAAFDKAIAATAPEPDLSFVERDTKVVFA